MSMCNLCKPHKHPRVRNFTELSLTNTHTFAGRDHKHPQSPISLSLSLREKLFHEYRTTNGPHQHNHLESLSAARKVLKCIVRNTHKLLQATL